MILNAATGITYCNYFENLRETENIVTIDAMGCQKEIADKKGAKGADYVLA
jgi:predicted transposase YbfD/YdcC